MVKRDKAISLCTLIADYDSAGGLQIQANLLVEQLAKNGVKVYVLTRNSKRLKRYERRDNVVIYRFPVIGSLRAANSIIYIVYSLLWLILYNKKYKILHCHQSYSPATIGSLAKLILNKPIIVKVSGSNEYGEVTEIKRLPFRRVRLFLLKRVDRFIILNEEMRKELHSINILDEKIRLIPNGVEIPEGSAFDNQVKMYYRKRLGLPYKDIVIYSGRLTEGKGLEMLVELWDKIIHTNPGAHLVLLGKGGEFRSIEERLKGRTKSLSISHMIHFMGHVTNVKEYLMASDIFVLPSISEGMSNALLEAMSCGVSIITTKIEANRGLITDGVNGMLIERQNMLQLKGAINSLLNNHSLRESLGRKAKETAFQYYSIEFIAKKYRETYEELISR